MKKILAAAVLVSACAFGVPAHATCAAAGQYYSGSLTYNNVSIEGTGWGTVFGSAGPAQACDDASAPGLGAPHVTLTIKVGGQVACSITDADGLTFGYDPFVFGGGFHAHGGSCGADVSFDALSGPGTPNGASAGSVGTTGYGAANRTAASTGTYWLNGDEPIEIPSLTPGTWGMGAQAGAI